ncbi:hypothetical protein F2P56_012185 [Juglans regia]|uniref:DUF4408 domain-containing protein n=2 Tax=Juglans regia TaxID=51240 RepID=A0A833XIF0_JUGRE|nr:pathogen-associated molecular patterns-induced protein A70-like [Juglans regia]KAF5467987.1 hypothetical protein F2P56_012185 [Juglans regia]
MFEESVSSSSTPSIWASINSWFTFHVLFCLLNLMIITIGVTSRLGNQRHRDQQQQNQEAQEQPQRPQIARSSSVLQRLKSINFYSYRSQEPSTTFEQFPESETHYAFKQSHEQEELPLTRSPSVLQRLKSINFYSYLYQGPGTVQSHTTTGLQKTQEFDTHYSSQELKGNEDEEDEQTQDQEQDQYQEQSMDEIYGRLQSAHVTRSKSDTKPASGEVPKKLSRKMKKSASSKSAFAHFEEDEIVETRRPATVREGKVGGAESDDNEVDAKADDFINRFKQQLKLQRLDSIMRYKELIHRGTGK